MSKKKKSTKSETVFPREDEYDARPEQDPQPESIPPVEAVSVEIIEDAPMPKQRRPRESKYPWDSLGLSYTQGPGGPLVGPMMKVAGTTRTIASQAWHAGKVRGKKFAVRDLGGGYVGVWRTS